MQFGYDALAKKYGDMFEMGVVDPVKVVRIALQHAAGRAGLMLTTDTVITDLKDKDSTAVGAIACTRSVHRTIGRRGDQSPPLV